MSLEENILRKKIKKSKSPPEQKNKQNNSILKQKKVVIEYEDDEDSKINENKEEIQNIPLKIKQKKHKNNKNNKSVGKEECLLPEKSNKYNSLSICFPDSIIALHQVNFFFRKF